VSGRQRGALALGYAAATFLAFPHPIAGRVLDLGLLMGWVAPALFYLLVRDQQAWGGIRWGFFGSLAAHSLVLHWIYVVTVTYGHAPVIVGIVAPIGLAVYIALFGAGVGGTAAWLGARSRLSPLGFALVWTVFDHARSWFLTGFPWATLGYAQHENPGLLPWASVTGVYGLSFVSALGGAALAELSLGGEPRRRRLAGATLGICLAVHAASLLLPDPREDEGETIRVAVVQGNIDQGVKWNRSWSERTLARYERLTQEAVADGAQIVVWPETAVPGTVDGDPELRARLERLAQTTGASLLVGGVGVIYGGDGRPVQFFDSAYTVEPERGFTDRYDKAHLVPFGEYVPLRSVIGLFIKAVASGIATSDVSIGAGPRAVALGDAPALRVGAVICFELLFPDLVRRFAADGGEMLLAITNDAWYGRTGAPYQFLAITALRSAETGLWTARAANTGISGFIDGSGRVREQTPIFEMAWRAADVPRHRDPGNATFYVRFGDLFAYGCWLLLALQLARVWRASRVRPTAE
jgi:apolipoprotein N-acyltransferase